MSKLIALSDSRFIASDQVSEVYLDSNKQYIKVLMRSGIIHSHQPECGSSVYRSLDKLIMEINSALAPSAHRKQQGGDS